jgi:hypothetical protein
VKPFFGRQGGATLLVVLVMLVMITLFVVSMIRLSSTNLKVVGNMQAQRALEASAQQAIENSISSYTFFSDAANNTGQWPAGNPYLSPAPVVNGYVIQISRPGCISSGTATGYSLTSNISPEDTNWEVPASSTDSLTGAQVNLVQGVKMRLPAGNCP